MFIANTRLADRVVRRYLNSRSDVAPRDHAIFWTIPPQSPAIPDDIAVQCSDGCTITAKDVEAAVSKTRAIMPGSCKLSEVHAREETNRARFKVNLPGGQIVGGSVTVNVVAHDGVITAFSLIELNDERT